MSTNSVEKTLYVLATVLVGSSTFSCMRNSGSSAQETGSASPSAETLLMNSSEVDGAELVANDTAYVIPLPLLVPTASESLGTVAWIPSGEVELPVECELGFAGAPTGSVRTDSFWLAERAVPSASWLQLLSERDLGDREQRRNEHFWIDSMMFADDLSEQIGGERCFDNAWNPETRELDRTLYRECSGIRFPTIEEDVRARADVLVGENEWTFPIPPDSCDCSRPEFDFCGQSGFGLNRYFAGPELHGSIGGLGEDRVTIGGRRSAICGDDPPFSCGSLDIDAVLETVAPHSYRLAMTDNTWARGFLRLNVSGFPLR